MQIVTTLHEAFNQRDRDALLATLSEDVVWHVPGNDAPADGFAGRQAVWEEVFEPLWLSPARLREHEVIEHGEHAVALTEWLHNFGDGEQRFESVEVLRLADGLIVERHEHISRHEELNRLFARGCAGDGALEP